MATQKPNVADVRQCGTQPRPRRSAMQIETLGEGEPKIAIVGGIHGDEPCGVHAVETLLDELRGCRTLALHATQSTARPFALVTEIGAVAERLCPQLSIDAVIEAGSCVGTALGAHITAIEVECGLQGTEQATAAAERLISEFLQATGAMPGPDAPERTLPVYQLREAIPKRNATAYEVLVNNFERVEKDTPFATIDGEPQTAEEAFYPVLLSASGYERQFGYAADLIDTLEPRETTEAQASADGMVTAARH